VDTVTKIWLLLFLYLPTKSVEQETSVVLQNLETLLINNKSSASQILANNQFMHLHGQTTFRELIKKYAPVGKITIITPNEPGRRVTIKCQVIDKAGKPFFNALVYAYQTSAKGWYSDTAAHILTNEGDYRHARLFGYVLTDKEGWFELSTIQPAGYPKSDFPGHIHIAMWKNDVYVRGLPGELQFEDDIRLTPERKQRSLHDGFLVSKNTGTNDWPVYLYHIKLRE
jgi:protocatechuate 3,4-dioxygenase beta subunit